MSDLIPVFIWLATAWFPVSGLIWLAHRTERQALERLARENTKQLEIVRITRGRR